MDAESLQFQKISQKISLSNNEEDILPVKESEEVKLVRDLRNVRTGEFWRPFAREVHFWIND